MFLNQIERKINQNVLPWGDVQARLSLDEIGKQDIQTDILWMEKDGTLTIDGVKGFSIPKEVESQIFSRLIPGGVSYLKKCNPELRAYNINHWLWKNMGKQFLVRTKEAIDGKIVRAVLSERYAKMDNLPVFGSIREQFQDDFVPVDMTLNNTQFHLRLAYKQGVDVSKKTLGDIVHGGIDIGNNELGNGSLFINMTTYRLVCKNSMVVPDELNSYTKTHAGKELDMRDFFNRAIVDSKTRMHQVLLNLYQAQDDCFDRVKSLALVEYIGSKYGWKEPFVESVQNRLLFEEQNKFGLIQAITEASKAYNIEQRLSYERQAGSLLSQSVSKMADAAIIIGQASQN